MTFWNSLYFRNDKWLSLRNDGAKFSSAKLFWSVRTQKICGRKCKSRFLRTNLRQRKEVMAWRLMPGSWLSKKHETQRRDVNGALRDVSQRLYTAVAARTAGSVTAEKKCWRMRSRKLQRPHETVWVPSHKSAPKCKYKPRSNSKGEINYAKNQ